MSNHVEWTDFDSLALDVGFDNFQKKKKVRPVSSSLIQSIDTKCVHERTLAVVVVFPSATVLRRLLILGVSTNAGAPLKSWLLGSKRLPRISIVSPFLRAGTRARFRIPIPSREMKQVVPFSFTVDRGNFPSLVASETASRYWIDHVAMGVAKRRKKQNRPEKDVGSTDGGLHRCSVCLAQWSTEVCLEKRSVRISHLLQQSWWLDVGTAVESPSFQCEEAVWNCNRMDYLSARVIWTDGHTIYRRFGNRWFLGPSRGRTVNFRNNRCSPWTLYRTVWAVCKYRMGEDLQKKSKKKSGKYYYSSTAPYEESWCSVDTRTRTSAQDLNGPDRSTRAR